MNGPLDITAAALVSAAQGPLTEVAQDILDGTAYFERHPTYLGHDGLPQTCATVAGCADQVDPVTRLAYLLTQAHRQLMQGAPPDLRGDADRVLFLALPAWLAKQSGFLSRFEQQVSGLGISNIRYHFGGPIAGLQAIAAAQAALSTAECTDALVAGIDTMVAPMLLDARALAGLANTKANSYGAIPGEAGAMLLMRRAEPDADERAGAQGAVARLMSCAIQPEPQRLDDPSRGIIGTGLVNSIKEARRIAGARGADMLISDFNGERFRAEELGMIGAHFGEEALHEPFCPAASIGEIGAATSIAYCCLAAYANAGTAATQEALIAISDRTDLRGALCVARARRA